MSTLEQWLTEVAGALGVDADAVNVRPLLDLTRDVAHSVARPAGPLTTFLVGVAVGRGTDPAAAIGTVAALAARRAPERDADQETQVGT